MAFEKAFENTYDELSEETKYRFAELEMSNLFPQLLTIFQSEYAEPQLTASFFIYKAIVPTYLRNDQNERDFLRTMNTHGFKEPHSELKVKYLIIHGMSYNKIRKLIGVSFNTIANKRYGLPTYFPILSFWDEEMLNNWNRIKTTFNIWNEDLVHTKK